MRRRVCGFMNDLDGKVYTSELSLANKFARGLWAVIYILFFRITPRPMHDWRCCILRLFGAEIGVGVKVYGSARIWAPWHLRMGDGAILGDRVDCYSVTQITIGAHSVISQDSCLCAATHDHRSDAFTLIPKPILIGDRAWIAARAFVGPGVTVGKHAVVGACAVVFKDVSDGVTVVGNPAKEISRKVQS